jgi:hypothetical protein
MLGGEPVDCETMQAAYFMVLDEAVASRALSEALWAPFWIRFRCSSPADLQASSVRNHSQRFRIDIYYLTDVLLVASGT